MNGVPEEYTKHIICLNTTPQKEKTPNETTLAIFSHLNAEELAKSEELNKKYKLLPIHVLENTQDSIVYELPAGKPDPEQSCMLPVDHRTRVLQNGCKGSNCLYYGMNFIRFRSDKLQRLTQTKERMIEQIGSMRRKEIMQSSKLLPKIFCDDPDLIKFLKSMNREKINERFQNEETKKNFLAVCNDPEMLEGGYPSLFPFIEEFLKEKTSENMYDFLSMKKIKIFHDIDLTCLKRLDFKLQLFSHYDFMESVTLTRRVVQNTFVQLYNLGKSTWTPANTIEELIIELKRVGPLLISGIFGECCFVDPPFKMEHTLKDRDIYTWAPNVTPISNGGPIHVIHSVLLVGASKVQEGALVYFIDPNDPSDPMDRSKQKIYKISFNNLTTHITNMNGFFQATPDVPYAYHGNFQIVSPKDKATGFI